MFALPSQVLILHRSTFGNAKALMFLSASGRTWYRFHVLELESRLHGSLHHCISIYNDPIYLGRRAQILVNAHLCLTSARFYSSIMSSHSLASNLYCGWKQLATKLCYSCAGIHVCNAGVARRNSIHPHDPSTANNLESYTKVRG